MNEIGRLHSAKHPSYGTLAISRDMDDDTLRTWRHPPCGKIDRGSCEVAEDSPRSRREEGNPLKGFFDESWQVGEVERAKA